MQEQQQWASAVWKQILASGQLGEEDTAAIYYSTKKLGARLEQLAGLFQSPVIHTVAIKTNPHPHILKHIVAQGFGLEAASFEEVQLALQAGAKPEQITYNSPVKTLREIRYCEEQLPGLRLNANSLEELERISAKGRLNLGLRVNPLIQASESSLYDVSGRESKFGVPFDQAGQIVEACSNFSVNTLHVHIGSQVSRLDLMVEALGQVVSLAERIPSIRYFNMGGGIAAGKSAAESYQRMQEYITLLYERILPFREGKYVLLTEFGQWVHKHNGLVFSRVEYVKSLEAGKKIAYVHVGADLFLREAYTSMNALNFICLDASGELLNRAQESFDIAGPLCFNGDYLGKNVLLPTIGEGDVLAMPSTGANAYGLWSRHCSRTIPAIFSDGLDAEPQTNGDVVKIQDRQSVWNKA